MKCDVHLYTNKRASNNSCDRIIATATAVVDDDSNNDIVVEKNAALSLHRTHSHSKCVRLLTFIRSGVRNVNVFLMSTFNIVDMQITWCECQQMAEKTFKLPQISLKIWLTSLIRYTLGLYRFNVYRHYVIALILYTAHCLLSLLYLSYADHNLLIFHNNKNASAFLDSCVRHSECVCAL